MNWHFEKRSTLLRKMIDLNGMTHTVREFEDIEIILTISVSNE